MLYFTTSAIIRQLLEVFIKEKVRRYEGDRGNKEKGTEDPKAIVPR
jgi:hypothetical protein